LIDYFGAEKKAYLLSRLHKPNLVNGQFFAQKRLKTKLFSLPNELFPSIIGFVTILRFPTKEN